MKKIIFIWLISISLFGQVERGGESIFLNTLGVFASDVQTFPFSKTVLNHDSTKYVFRYYVDTAGSSSNDGQSWASPKSSIYDVFTEIGTWGVSSFSGYALYIFVKPGTYEHTTAIPLNNFRYGTAYIYWYGTPMNDDGTAFETWARNGETVSTSYDSITVNMTTASSTLFFAENVNIEFISLDDDLGVGNGLYYGRWVFSNTGGGSGSYLYQQYGNVEGYFVRFYGVYFDLSAVGGYGVESAGKGALQFIGCGFYGGTGQASTSTSKWRAAISFSNFTGSGLYTGSFGGGFNFVAGYSAPLDDGLYFQDIARCITLPFGINSGVIMNNTSLWNLTYKNTGSGIATTDIYIENTTSGATIVYNSDSNFTVTDNSTLPHTLIDLGGGSIIQYLSANIQDVGNNVGIGIVPDSGRIQIYDGSPHDLYLGDASTWSYADAGAGWTTSSDSTLKENIIPIENLIAKAQVANKIENTPLYRYNFKKESLGWKDVTGMPDNITIIGSQGQDSVIVNQAKLDQITLNERAIEKSAQKHFGFLAQDFGTIWENNPNATTVNWQKVAVIQWYAIQELIKTVKDHEARLQTLE